MKKTLKTLSTALIISQILPLNAQITKRSTQQTPVAVSAVNQENIQPFSKGSLKFMLNNPVNINLGSYNFDGEKISSYRDIEIRGNATYFIRDGIGVGAQMNLDRNKSINAENSDYTTLNRYFSFGLHGVYGQEVGGINMYVQPSVSFGSNKYENDYGFSSSDDKDNVFQLGIKAGALLPLGGDASNAYFSPHLGWNFTKYTDKENSTNNTGISKFFVGGGITLFIPTVNIPCDCHTGFGNVAPTLVQGTNVFEFNNRFELGSYNYNQEYEGFEGEISEDENSRVDFEIGIAYKRAIIDDLFVGLNAYLNADKFDYEQDPESIERNVIFDIGPAVQYYPFDQKYLNNAFVGSEFTLGSEKNTDDDGESDANKYARTSFNLHAGYDYGITPNIFLFSQLGYELFQSKNKESEIKRTSSGFYFEVGTSVRLRWE